MENFVQRTPIRMVSQTLNYNVSVNIVERIIVSASLILDKKMLITMAKVGNNCQLRNSLFFKWIFYSVVFFQALTKYLERPSEYWYGNLSGDFNILQWHLPKRRHHWWKRLIYLYYRKRLLIRWNLLERWTVVFSWSNRILRQITKMNKSR